jgi:hypothetical protein
MASGSFTTQHPWMTFFLAIIGISAVVAVVQSPTVQKVAGLPPILKKKGPLAGPALPPKRV